MAVLAIDVDQTVVDSGTLWLDWLNEKSGKNLTLEQCAYDYNLGKFFPEIEDPYAFWRCRNLYDDMIPRDDALRIIPKLCKEHTVIFVSAIKGDHHKSKYTMLKRRFPDMKGFIATKEKQFVKCDVIIEDRNSFLNLFGYDVIKIKVDTPYTQKESLEGPVLVVDDWYEIYNHLQKLGY